MEIAWLSHACFQLRGKNVTLITDPYSPQQGTHLQLSKLNPAIVTLSHNHSDFTPVTEGNPYIVRGPGEYEISDVLITGVASYRDNKQGQEHGRNTIYVIHIDDVVVCHLGELGHTLTDEQLEEVADADVLLIPIGGDHVLNAPQAMEVISQVEPRIVIPMHYSAQAQTPDGVSEALNKFCREMGVKTMNTQPKMTVTRTSIPSEMQVVLLTPRA